MRRQVLPGERYGTSDGEEDEDAEAGVGQPPVKHLYAYNGLPDDPTLTSTSAVNYDPNNGKPLLPSL